MESMFRSDWGDDPSYQFSAEDSWETNDFIPIDQLPLKVSDQQNIDFSNTENAEDSWETIDIIPIDQLPLEVNKQPKTPSDSDDDWDVKESDEKHREPRHDETSHESQRNILGRILDLIESANLSINSINKLVGHNEQAVSLIKKLDREVESHSYWMNVFYIHGDQEEVRDFYRKEISARSKKEKTIEKLDEINSLQPQLDKAKALLTRIKELKEPIYYPPDYERTTPHDICKLFSTLTGELSSLQHAINNCQSKEISCIRL